MSAEIKSIPKESSINETKHKTRTDGIKSAVLRFVNKLEGIKTSEEIVMPLIDAHSSHVEDSFERFVAENQIKKTEGSNSTTFSIPVAAYAKFEKLTKRRLAIHSAADQTPRALFVALVSAYDAFLGELLREVFILKPEILNSSNRSFTFLELVELNSLSAAREHLIEKEVESVLRESHEKHFSWMENRFSLNLRADLASWSTFIELTERRNLFVHTDGVVSAQYCTACKAAKGNQQTPKPGSKLGIDPGYFELAFECLFEIGVKLSQVISRKFCPEELEQIDNHLNDICFDLLKSEKYRLAANLLEFSLNSLKKHSSALIRRIFVVNLGIAYKLGKLGTDPKAHLDKEDWSDCAPHFKLAKAVLSDQYKDAKSLMLSLGKKAQGIQKLGYETWPLFKEFRESEEFRSAFEQLYGEKLLIPETQVSGLNQKAVTKKVPAKKAPAKKAPAMGSVIAW